MNETNKLYKNSVFDIIIGQAFVPTLILIVILSISKWAVPTFYVIIVTTSLIVWLVLVTRLKLAVVSSDGIQIRTLLSCKKYDFNDIESVCTVDGFMDIAECHLLLNMGQDKFKKTWFSINLNKETAHAPQELFNVAFLRQEGETVGFIRKQISRNCGVNCDEECAMSDSCDIIHNRTVQKKIET
jgi:hypothetical protein